MNNNNLTFEEILNLAKKSIKGMTDAVMIANENFDKYMFNFLITDGETSVSADWIDDYFIVNDGNQEIRMDTPCTQCSKRKVYNLGLSFLKTNTYTVELNA